MSILRKVIVRVTDDMDDCVSLVQAKSEDDGITWQVFIDDVTYCYERNQSPQYMQELVNRIAIEADNNYHLTHPME